jgi:coenzyme PQQ precursor peptide PqqA
VSQQSVPIWRFDGAIGFITRFIWRANQSCKGGNTMAWKTPKIVEIALGAEINCYACAEVK